MGVYLGRYRVGVETPAYTVLESSAQGRGYELREMPAYVVAECLVAAGTQHQGRDGFRALAGYIGAFGDPKNEGAAPIKMTAPLLSSEQPGPSGQKIAMTAPVLSAEGQAGDRGYWMAFTMPSKWTLETLPKPSSPSVKLREVPKRTVAALYFSGRTNETVVAEKEAELLRMLDADGVQVAPDAEPVLARYNDPFTPGFLRTNEIWIQINR